MQEAARLLLKGGLVAFPTETVYGLGADAENPFAVSTIYNVKNRPADHPVIIHIADSKDVLFWARSTPEYAHALMRDYWPGPMTLILSRSPNAKSFITGGQDSVGLRVPNHPIALGLILEFQKQGGHGLAAPSANRYGAVSPTTKAAVELELREYLAPTDLILEGGLSQVGIESTIIDCTGSSPIILRPGAISAEMIEISTGIVVTEPPEQRLRVSGSHKRHYSPKARVLIDKDALFGEGFIALSDVPTPFGAIRLCEPKTIEDYARELYVSLRKADELELKVVRIVQPLGDGLAIALRDRIARSAAKG
ncbi:L-threonylcarbamoyladenylate synthase [Candidatus Aquiluna sp. UB-MaderosW2red]|nr:L-threonylcarbamoyladenylate synthase [Candidatus Aquiluna sp. UB-MaderosW2red]